MMLMSLCLRTVRHGTLAVNFPAIGMSIIIFPVMFMPFVLCATGYLTLAVNLMPIGMPAIICSIVAVYSCFPAIIHRTLAICYTRTGMSVIAFLPMLMFSCVVAPCLCTGRVRCLYGIAICVLCIIAIRILRGVVVVTSSVSMSVSMCQSR